MSTPTPSAPPVAPPAPTPTPKPTEPAATDPPKVDSPVGDSPKPDSFKSEESKKAVLADLAKEREARKALEAKFDKLGEALGVEKPKDGKTDFDQLSDRLAKHEQSLTDERSARWRAEVANDKKLTAEQSKFLTGSTREEIEVSADALLAAFPTQENGARAPKPDPSQGSRGPVDLDAQIAEAEKKGDVRASIRLKQEKARAARAAQTR